MLLVPDRLNRRTGTTNGDTDLRIQSWVGEVAYRIDRWLPKLKLESSKVSEDRANLASLSRDFLRAGLIFEYTPEGLENGRYHLGAIHGSRKQAGTDERIETQIIAGFGFAHDFLK